MDFNRYMNEKSRKMMGASRSKDLDFNSELAEKRWVWAEVKIWNHMMLYIKGGRKIMGLGQSKDLDLLMCYKGKWQRNHGLSWSKDLDFNSE